MTTITLPAPTVTTPHSYHEPGRSRAILYKLGERPDGKTDAVKIYIGHDKRGKQFYASINRITIEVSPGFIAEHYAPLDGVRLPGKPVGRFSAKAMDAYAAEVVKIFPTVVAVAEHEPRLAKLLSTTYHDDQEV